MYNLPDSTIVHQQLPKKTIYEKFKMKASQRESFDTDIARIDIIGIISSSTIPALAEGENIKEFYVLAIQLKRKEYDVKNIIQLTKLIPQKMILALSIEEQVQFAIYHTKLISSIWQSAENAKLSLLGLNLDIVWDNLVKEIGRIEVNEGHTLIEQIKTDEEQAKLLIQIKTLERKMANEKQPRWKREYFEQIKKLKNLL